MNTFNEMTDRLAPLNARHNSFKSIFNKFQENINHLKSDAFPVQDISLEHITDEKTVISYIGRTYEITFSSAIIDTAFKGKVTVIRITNNDETNDVASITYNGQSVVDVQPPIDEDPISLNEDNCCINLVLNWISSDIYSQQVVRE